MRFIFVACLALVFSCKKSEVLISKNLSDYYQLKSLDSFVYAVDRKIYNEILPDTFERFFVKEVVGKKFASQSFELLRYKSQNQNGPWRLDSIWAVRIEPNRIVRIENGVPFVVLSSPIGQNWDRNFYNIYPKDEFVYSPDCLKDLLCVEASHKQKNLLFKRSRTAKYQIAIGLIEERIEILNYINDSQSPDFGKDTIASGISIIIKRIF